MSSPASALTFENIVYEKNGPIAHVTLTRPKVLNALNQSVFLELKAAFEDARDDSSVRGVILTGGASLYGFIIFAELEFNPGAEDLGRLARMVADGRLHPEIRVEAPWTQIGEIAQKLLNRQISGKAVLHVSS